MVSVDRFSDRADEFDAFRVSAYLTEVDLKGVNGELMSPKAHLGKPTSTRHISIPKSSSEVRLCHVPLVYLSFASQESLIPNINFLWNRHQDRH